MKATKEDFQKYEGVRASGVTNMFDVKMVQELTHLSETVIYDIMRNYSAYAKKWK